MQNFGICFCLWTTDASTFLSTNNAEASVPTWEFLISQCPIHYFDISFEKAGPRRQMKSKESVLEYSECTLIISALKKTNPNPSKQKTL